MAKSADVLVVGGGPSGAACAALLAQRGVNVVLLANSRNQNWPELLSPAAVLALDRADFPSDELKVVAQPCRGVVDCWLPGLPMYTDFELLRCGLGWVLDRGAFDESLLRFAAECGVRVSEAPTNARLINSPRDHDAAPTVTREGEKWTADFVVDATGAAGSLLPQGENRRARYDRLIAVRVALSVAPDPTDWMHLATSKSGWWYTLTGTEGATEAVFMTDSDLLPRDPIARWQHLTSEFRDAFPNKNVSLVVADRVLMRDAGTTCRRRVWAGRWLPIGDARVTLDLLTGAGLERALGFAEVGAELVADFLTSRSFRSLEANAIDFLHYFEATLMELRRRYKMAADESLYLDAAFWQRRCNVAGLLSSN